MKFYNRTQELQLLGQLQKQTAERSRMTVLIGRRRVGKTKLALEFAKGHKHLYFFVAKKSERLLCEDFLAEVNTPPAKSRWLRVTAKAGYVGKADRSFTMDFKIIIRGMILLLNVLLYYLVCYIAATTAKIATRPKMSTPKLFF